MLDELKNYISFIPMNADGAKFFGFAEFLTGVALTILTWTMADTRYHFRISTARFNVKKVSFWAVAIIGSLTLLTDLWRAEQWLVPDFFITAAMWQGFLAAGWFTTVLIWAWIGFINPPVFGPKNAKNFAITLYSYILKGNVSELATIANELSRSTSQLIHYTPLRSYENFIHQDTKRISRDVALKDVNTYAKNILFLIGDKKFCKSIIEYCPKFAVFIFGDINKKNKFNIEIQQFAKNLMIEGINNKESFLYRESDSSTSGFLGNYKPLSRAMLSNYKLVETIGSLFDYEVFPSLDKLKNSHLDAYCRAALIVIESYVAKHMLEHSITLYEIFDGIKKSTHDLYIINGNENISFWNDSIQREITAINFIRKALQILEAYKIDKNFIFSRCRKDISPHDLFYYLTEAFFQMICDAASVKSPWNLCWSVQFQNLWNIIFCNFDNESNCKKILQFKIRRKLYDEIKELENFPNNIGFKILGFCLNVMGFVATTRKNSLGEWPLHKAVLSWTKKNYVSLHDYNPSLAEEYLVDGMSYDPQKKCLVKRLRTLATRPKVEFVYFKLNAPSAENIVSKKVLQRSRRVFRRRGH